MCNALFLSNLGRRAYRCYYRNRRTIALSRERSNMVVLLVACLVAVAGALIALLAPRAAPALVQRTVSGPDEHDQRASDRLVSLIDLLFALVLTLPVFVTEDVVRAPWDGNLPTVMALTIAYYVVIRSFVDWHIAMEDAPYWIRTSDHKSWELRRVYVDFAIVMAYVMLFLSIKELSKHPGTDIGQFLLLLAIIIGCYLLWGALRWIAYREQHEYRWHTLVEAVVGFAAVWAAYRIDRDEVGWFADHSTARNTTALALAFVLLAAYRLRNWREIRHVRTLASTTPQPGG
jgi:hypothetical protein